MHMNESIFESRTFEPDKHEVQYYDHYLKTLKHTQKHKAKKFLKHNCIKYIGHSTFVCNPIEGYNTRSYTLKRVNNKWTCNCQFFVRMSLRGEDPICSHIMALFLAFKSGRFMRKREDGNENN